MEQRCDAVVEVIRGVFSVSEAPQKFGVSRQSLYRWMVRYEEDGLEALAEDSHRPKHIPHQMHGEIEISAKRRPGPSPIAPCGLSRTCATWAHRTGREAQETSPLQALGAGHNAPQISEHLEGSRAGIDQRGDFGSLLQISAPSVHQRATRGATVNTETTGVDAAGAMTLMSS